MQRYPVFLFQVDSFAPGPHHPVAEAEALPQLRRADELWMSFGHVVFQGVGLRYTPEGPWALREVDLEIQPGETLGVVGRTGGSSVRTGP